MKTVAVIQARMGSSRLPGKVLLPVLGRPLLDYQIERVRRSKTLDEVRIATSTDPKDDVLAKYCSERGIPCTRGSENDVLARYYDAAVAAKADIVVRLTADCPLIDPAVIDSVVSAFRSTSSDYASNCLERTYPRGMDTEVFSFTRLEEAFRLAQSPSQREHVTPYLHQQPEKFRLKSVTYATDQHQHRWTVDMPEDFELVKRLLEELVPRKGLEFTLEDLLHTIALHPDWALLNAHIEQKKI